MDFLDKFGGWMALNSEAIYATRPWKIAGEGPTQAPATRTAPPRALRAATSVHHQRRRAVRDRAGLPDDGKLVIKSLAADSPHFRGEIARIGSLGQKNLALSRNAEGVTINLPEKPPYDYAWVFKIN